LNVFESQPKLFKALSSAAVFSEARSYIKNKTGFFLEINNSSAQAMFIGALFHALNQSVFVVQENGGGAEESHENLSGLIDDRAFILPNCEEDALNVPGLVFSSRTVFSHSLSALLSDKAGVFVSSLDAIKTKIRAPKEIVSGVLALQVGDTFQQSTIVEKLLVWGYEPADPCLTPKTFAKRGGILDVFTEFSGHPLRFEFLGNKIDSIRIFNPDTQLSEGLRSACVLFPPVFSPGNDEISLNNIIEEACSAVLYITSKGVSFLSPDNSIKIETVALKFPNNGLVKNKKVIDGVLDNKKIVSFFYNPTKRSLYRQKELFPLSLGLPVAFILQPWVLPISRPRLGPKN